MNNKERCEDLLKSRFEKVVKVGIYKKHRGIPPLDEKRWNEVLRKVSLLAKEVGIPEIFIIDIWNKIHLTALNLEEKATYKGGEELNLEEIRMEINQIDSKLVKIIGEIFQENGEEKTRHIIMETLQKIEEVL